MADVEGVREYDRIRRFLGRIYLYGFFSREDFAKAGVGSVKDYDYGAKLIRAIFPDSGEAAVWQAGKKYLRIQRDYARSGENRLADSYMLHTLDETEELPELLYILAALAAGPKTLGELCFQVELNTRSETFKYATVRRRVLDLAEYGYVEKRDGRFALARDGLSDLTDRELRQTDDFVRFAGGVTYPRAVGSFLRRTLKRELLRRGLSPAGQAPFLLRHSVNANVFDEELVYQLLDIMTQRRMAVLDLDGGQVTALPAALRADARLGRWYLLTLEEDHPVLRRVSRIRGVKAGSAVPPETYQAEGRRVRAAFAASVCSGAVAEGGLVLVRAELRFAPMPGLLAQFRRELRVGEVTDGPEGLLYQARVNDPLELLPLLRSYAPWLRVLPGDHDLDARLRQDLLTMRRQAEEAEV